MDPLENVATAQRAASTAASTESANANPVSSDFETFLRMLTVQVQNQDPLNPVDATDYATQLATFSSVEQQVLTNDLLKEVQAVIGGNALQEVSTWLGMEALAIKPVNFDGAPVVLRPEYRDGADASELIVRNSDGDEVQRFTLIPAEDDRVLWDGLDEFGNPLPSDTYSFSLESFANGESLGTQSVASYHTIVEVSNGPAGAVVHLADGTEISPNNVDGLRFPQF